MAKGTWYDFFAGKVLDKYGAAWGPGFATFQYSNRASTIWYHDHALGMTRLNVYAGPAGFHLVRGGPAGDKAVLDNRTGLPAVLPGPAPKDGDKFFYNFTADAHPMHVHEVVFEVVNRQALALDPDTGEPVQPVQLSGDPRPPEAWESGFKDTVIAYPGEVTRIRAKFDTAGQFAWHCHIVEHEDNDDDAAVPDRAGAARASRASS